MDQRHRPFSERAGSEPVIEPGAFDVHDPLLAALEYLAGHHGRPFSAAAVRQGLPLQGGLLTLDLCARGA